MRFLIVLIAFFAVCSGYLSGLISNKEWDTLQLKWDVKFANAFYNMPATVDDALDYGFTKISDCDLNGPWRGARYVLNKDHTIILLFDIKGNIAGIQAAIPNDLTDGYPFTTLQPPFIQDGNTWVITAYFTDPAIICTSGRSDSDVYAEPVGSNLYFQNSTSPEESILIPRDQKDIVATKWSEGQCFPTMGKHYWYNLSDDMSCETIFPFFLLYNDGNLNGFGFSFVTEQITSSFFEHPTIDVIPKFMYPVPKCMHSYASFSTMHVYLTDYVALNWC